MPTRDKPDRSALAKDLLNWFRKHRRDLPFRRTRDPYAIWVAETMLQQTQVATMLPYYERFLERFPTIQALAGADIDEVLRFWAGLGYYRRARHLHEAAKQVVQRHGGQFPCGQEDVLSLPGIGRYTAGAILSIAFGQAEPVLDGNVSRVLARSYEVRGDPKKGPANGRLWTLARELIPPESPGGFNQALMELGALVCTPKAPSCPKCPISRHCGAFRAGTVARYPETGPAEPTESIEAACAVIHRNGNILVAQRPKDGLLGGLWEFPAVERTGRLPARSLLRRAVRSATGLEIEVGECLVTVRHFIMNRRISVEAYLCEAGRGEPRALKYDDVRWISREQLLDIGLSSAPGRIAKALLARGHALPR